MAPSSSTPPPQDPVPSRPPIAVAAQNRERPPGHWPAQSLPANWRSWPELTVRIHGLPTICTASMVWQQFHQYGQIAFIEVYSPSGSDLMSARVKFSPPPHHLFWEHDSFTFRYHDADIRGKECSVRVRPDNRPCHGWLVSGVDRSRSYAGKLTTRLLGVRIGSRTGFRHFTAVASWTHTAPHPDFKIEVDVHRRKLSVYFHTIRQTAGGERLRRFKMQIDASQVRHIYRRHGQNGEDSLIVSLEFPPEYYWRRDDMAPLTSNALIWGEHDNWYRASCMADDLDEPLKYPVSVSDNLKEAGYVDIGRWTTCQILLDSTNLDRLKLFQEILADLNIRIIDANFEVILKGQPDMWSHLDCASAEATNALAMLQMWSHQIHLPFELRYQLESCISRNTLQEHNITRHVLEELAAADPNKVRARLEQLADQGKPAYDPMAYFADVDKLEVPDDRRLPSFCYLVRKATVTPTTMYLSVPSFETSNRVIREFSHVTDRFLKVQFVEEGEGGKMRAASGLNNDEVWKRVWRTLRCGIRIGDRLYEFLAFGNSQLRECGAYFFCATEHLSCDDIRRWAGDFDHIKVIAKYAARLGQCFSTTRILQGIPNPTIKLIPDIERNGYCFTDGVGKISRFLADFIAAEMPGNEGERPSAFQFRMGGSKGVLVISDDVKGKEVHIRPSQEKFKAKFNGLEIVRCARPATATLNRQTITILSDLGVPNGAFIGLLEQQLRTFDLAVRDNVVAVELLTKFVDHNQTSLAIAELIRSGFRTESLQEPFVLNVFRLWRSWSLKLLKEKARIHVEQSAFVLGCADETGTLRGHTIVSEGTRAKDVDSLPQIFLQTINPQTGKMFVLKGVCLVGRNPSLHPGDIRVVEAVDSPRLRHIKDMVVFPSQGDRPVPSMLSGGDLDGDDFFVIWDKSLLPRIWNWKPMDFSPVQPLELSKDVDSIDLRQFFVQYMMNDVLPLIAHAHLAWADQLKPRSAICLELAELHSHAVDYAKTGEPVAWDKREMWPKRWPHFMEKDIRNTYDSDQVLGRLYDNVTKDKTTFTPDWGHAFDRRVLERYSLHAESLAKARAIKLQYDQAVRRILAQLNIKTEFELWTGFAMTRPTIGTDYKRQEILGHEKETLKYRFRTLCEEAAGGSEPGEIDPFVAAMYKVTEDEMAHGAQEVEADSTEEEDWDAESRPPVAKQMPLITFPWLYPEVLVRIALGDKWTVKKPWYAPGPRASSAKQPDHAARNTNRFRPPHERTRDE